MPFEFRKRVVFAARLEPGQMNRFSCTFQRQARKPAPALRAESNCFTVETAKLHVKINTETGLLDQYAVNGTDYLQASAFLPEVMQDSDDSWGSAVRRFKEYAGSFTLMSAEAATAFSGVTQAVLPPVRVIEDGPIRTVVEALFAFGGSSLCLTYHIPKDGAELYVTCRVYWNEKRCMLKLKVPTLMKESNYHGQTAYGVELLPNQGDETIAQKWTAVVDANGARALTCINDGTYGSDCEDGVLGLSLLRSPGYSAFPFEGRPLMAQDRFSPRIDQGERLFRFWFQGGPAAERLAAVDREALVHNEKPVALAYFPPGPARALPALALLEDDVVQLTVFKQAERGTDYILRVFEPTGEARSTVLHIPVLGIRQPLALRGFEFRTYRLDVAANTLRETDLLEGL